MGKILFISILLGSIALSAQSWTLEKINTTPLDSDRFIAIDKFNALYSIKNNELRKSDAQNLYQYAALELGVISSVDILNPLRITLFYETTNTAVVLDNTLNEITRINFSTLDTFRNVSQVTTASDRRFWIFNTDLQQLEIFDWNLKRIITQFPPMEANAALLVSNFNFAWVANDNGLFYYNNYGSFLDIIDAGMISQIAQDKGALVILKNEQLFYKPKGSPDFLTVETPDLTIKQFSLNGEILYIYNGQELNAFRLQPAKQP